MEVFMTNNSLLKVNGSEEKVYKVEVLKLGKRVKSHFRLGGAFEHNFCPEGWKFKQINLNKFKCQQS